MRRIATLSTLVFAVACSNKLTRDTAADVIDRTDHSAATITYTTMPGTFGGSCDSARKVKGLIKVLADEGVFSMTPSYYGCEVRYTAKAQEIAKKEGWRLKTEQTVFEGVKSWYDVPAGKMKVTQVTGILQPEKDPSTAEVDFTFEVAYTDRLKAARKIGDPGKPETGTGKAILKKFDDGWRVVDLGIIKIVGG